jgi:1-deoxy-D-xylulose-5-phosphate synthase
MRFVKPLDQQLIDQLAGSHDLIVTLEENAIAGGAGAGVSEYLSSQGVNLPVLHLGLPDTFIDHGKHQDLLAACGLNTSSILHSIEQRLAILNQTVSSRESKLN